MSILFIGPLPEPVTGQSLACQVLLDELTRHHRVEIVNLSKKGFGHGVDSFSRIVQVLGILHAVWRGKKSADVIYLTVSESLAGNLKDLLIYLLCFKRLSQMAIHLHGGAGLRLIMLGRRGALRRANEFFVRRLGAAVVLGPRHADVFAHVLPREKIHLVPNFVEEYLLSDEASIEQKFRVTKPLRILFLSNLIPGKGHLELIEAFFALDPGVRESLAIDLAGGFQSETQRQEFLARIAGVPQIRYHGVVHGERKRDLFHQAHVFCLPTYYPYEGQPISLLEGYASGCAVITTDHSGIGDVFTAGLNGYRVEKKSPVSLKTAIERAVADPERLRSMALANLNSARQQYRTADYTAKLLRIVESLAGT